jgi:hypothetical protein
MRKMEPPMMMRAKIVRKQAQNARHFPPALQQVYAFDSSISDWLTAGTDLLDDDFLELELTDLLI